MTAKLSEKKSWLPLKRHRSHNDLHKKGARAARLLAPNANRKLTVLSALLGAVFLVLADIVDRVQPAAPKGISSGLVVALLGAPYFLWLMRTAGARSASKLNQQPDRSEPLGFFCSFK
ncbi:iron chelate uptake ABC transporter family permease subunit [Fontibacillus sp. BL9]|uniref:iron chelate uptake ABC transporter family permease subunit n=1 Tax=Fontibacillus sp. BL9 TaxID=3389971 RepID=UPI0039793F95